MLFTEQTSVGQFLINNSKTLSIQEREGLIQENAREIFIVLDEKKTILFYSTNYLKILEYISNHNQ